MSTLNNTDILVPRRTRFEKNKFKKNKGVKYNKDKKFGEQEFWKRARNIRFQKQSREDNFAGETFPEEDMLVESSVKVCETKDAPACSIFTWNHLGEEEKIEVYKYDANRRIPGHENDEIGWTYGSLTEDTMTICTNGINNIITTIVNVEKTLRAHDVTFHFEKNGAFWECHTYDNLFFLRLWLVDDDVLVLEPIVGMGEPATFYEFYYFKLFNSWWVA